MQATTFTHADGSIVTFEVRNLGSFEEADVHCHLGNIACRLGRSLEFDPQAETFRDTEANSFLKREYRTGFEEPKLA
jgi:hypothetical protein